MNFQVMKQKVTFHTREEAIAYLSGLSGQASLRETTLEDVFVERAGRHLMPS